MRIYVLHDNPYQKNQNPYVKTLIDGINESYNDVEWKYGLSTFWKDEIFTFDIIHVHWPNVFIWYNDDNINELNFEDRIIKIKEKGVKIISTCHNLTPHYSTNALEIKLYEIVYKYSDCIIHLGSYSLSLFQEKYPHSLNYLLYHHIYDSIYKKIPSYEDSIKALHLNPKMKYIICFGAFRNTEERNLIIKLSKYLKNRNVSILAPSFSLIPKRRNIFALIKPILRHYYFKYKYPNIKIASSYIDDENLPYYFAVSSVSLIQRLKILNSGNVTLAFLMKNVVVGPNVGNVGVWLHDTHNYTFEVNDVNTLFKAVDLALNDELRGEENYYYAINKLSVKYISSKLYHLYKTILNDRS